MWVVDTDTPSYRSISPKTVLQGAEGEKKRKYGSACVTCRASFTPLCVSVDRLLSKEAAFLFVSWLIVFPPSLLV